MLIYSSDLDDFVLILHRGMWECHQNTAMFFSSCVDKFSFVIYRQLFGHMKKNPWQYFIKVYLPVSIVKILALLDCDISLAY